MPEELSRYSIEFLGEAVSGEFSLCSGDYCTGPIPWNASADMVANAIRALGISVTASTGGPLPAKPIEVDIKSDDLTADETHSLSGTIQAYFGGALVSVMVGRTD